ncbi:ribosome small subunit-dependent GTPase A [Ectobacillus ponti]|uniref:Small ribosomal subunit biogenesis GTPase RsgA n=1 Tax=Ectobacillus ponti TaxID=2961894 RepID=A0AA42BQW1_9BACI|nr:ribosome small subunit-dependent GTPase A [Ectobacillus ponti]MCP8968874.1 ribosome small subunit-dependent GTPase A [Ectobacillus ponti]
MKNEKLLDLGWNEFFDGQCPAERTAGRIVLEHKHLYRVMTDDGEYLGELSGKFHYRAAVKSDYPSVGDWVWLTKLPDERKAVIHGVFTRRSAFSRKEAGERTEEQIVAANVDYVFLVNALNRDFNVRRLERYLLVAYESGAMPVIVLTKSDLCGDVAGKVAEAEGVAFGVPIVAVSSLEGSGIEQLAPYLERGRTVALLGSSGAGKSTLLNALAGRDVSKIGDIRESDDRGKHTTTHRELFSLASGALVIDTPGMRELQLWEGSDAIGAAFADIEAFGAVCRFSDCRHEQEPGCAVRAAIETGELPAGRLVSYNKLQKELAYAARKQDAGLARQEKEKWKKINQTMRKQGKKR